MLSGSAMLRVAVLLVTAGLLAGLVQYFWPQAAQEPSTRSEEPTVQRAPQPAPGGGREPVRTVPTAKAPPANPGPAPQPAPEAVPEPAPGATSGSPPGPSSGPSDPVPEPAAPPAPRTPAEVPPSEETGAAERAQDDAGPRAVALVDLNTATLAQLNGLKGGGNIGRAIIQRRPYSSIDQLLSKRVLSRATYERIRDQVTVQ